jgi:hypothetical protein
MSAIHDREATLGHDGRNPKDIRLHGADDPKNVVLHDSGHDTPDPVLGVMLGRCIR